MRYERIEEQKGLFTFYKQQQAEEDEIRRILKKRKKGKSKKQKKLQSIRQDASLSPTHSKDISLSQMRQSKQLSNYSKFLRNVISKQNSQLMLSHHQKAPTSFRIKTDHADKEHQSDDKEQIANFFVQKKLQAHKISLSNIIKQRQPKNGRKTEVDDSYSKVLSLKTKLQSFQQANKHQEASKPKQETLKGDKKLGSRSFLQKLKYLQHSNKSNLISNRDSIYVQDKQVSDLHSENKKYFQQLISNFYKHSDEKNQTGYKMIKDALRFPHIIKTDKTLRIKTQEESPIEAKQKVVTPLKSFSNNRRQIKKKSSHQKYIEIKPKDDLNSINTQEGKLLNFIDLSKDYSKQCVQSEQRLKKKKMVRCRLGLQL